MPATCQMGARAGLKLHALGDASTAELHVLLFEQRRLAFACNLQHAHPSLLAAFAGAGRFLGGQNA